MIAWTVGLALAGGSGASDVGGSAPPEPVPDVIFAPPAPVPDVTLAPPEPVPGVALARAGLISGYAGAPSAALGAPMFAVGLLGGSEALAYSGATLGLGGVAASVTGPILISVGQKQALDHLDARGARVPRVAKRVGDGMFIGGAATVGVSTILLYAGSDNAVPIAGLIAGGASMVLSLIPYEVQQGLIVRGARGARPVSLSVTPVGVSGRF